jgi:hypothetical protein
LDGKDFKDRQVSGTILNSESVRHSSIQWTHFPLTTSINYRTVDNSRAWFTGKFRLLTPPPNFNRLSATIAAFDFHQPIKNIWNSIPWTFLVDYFLNVSDYLEAVEGNLKFELSHLNLMFNGKSKTVATGDTWGWVSSPGEILAESKLREIWPIGVPRLSFDPILSGAQMTNLLALLLARRSR